MTDRLMSDEDRVLTIWLYSHDEWQQFVRWAMLKKGFLSYLLHIISFRKKPIPVVRITPDSIWIDDKCHLFRGDNLRLKKVDIRSEGKMNVMEITYGTPGKRTSAYEEIRILIPRGKLRDAISVQDRLQV